MLNVTEWHFALLFWLSLIQVSIQLVCRPKIEALPGEGGGGPMSLVWILKHFMSMFVNASRCCRELNKNSLSLLNFRKEGIAKRCKETITVLQFLS